MLACVLAGAYLGDVERERVEVLQRLLLAHLAALAPTPLRSTARALLAAQVRLGVQGRERVPRGQGKTEETPVSAPSARESRGQGEGKTRDCMTLTEPRAGLKWRRWRLLDAQGTRDRQDRAEVEVEGTETA